MPPTRLLIADNHTLVREGLRAIISVQPELELVGEATDGLEAVSLTLALQPDVLILDLAMPHQDGLATIAKIKQSGAPTHILVLTGLADDKYIFPAIQAGALGYLMKDASREELLLAIAEVAQGRNYWPALVANRLVKGLTLAANPPPSLTEREIETLRLLAQGLTNEQLAWRLNLSANTVARHINSILAKLKLTNRTQAVLYALRHGLASLDDTE